MQMGIAAPLLAMEARGATPAEVEAEAMKLAKVPFPREKLTALKGKAKKYCDDNSCQGFDETEYGIIALLLWDQFCGGVESGGAKIPESGTRLAKLLDAAYSATSEKSKDATSGELIASRVHEWGDKYKSVTNYCAFRCGIHAAQSAGIGMKITPHDYDVAFKKTSAEMWEMVERIKPEDRILGGGC